MTTSLPTTTPIPFPQPTTARTTHLPNFDSNDGGSTSEPPSSFSGDDGGPDWTANFLRFVKVTLRDHKLLLEIPDDLTPEEIRATIKDRLTLIQAAYELFPHTKDNLDDWIVMAIHPDKTTATAVWNLLHRVL